MPQLLHTARLELRPMSRSYLDALVELDSDPEVMRYLSNGVPTTREAMETVHLGRMLAYDAEPYGFFAVHHDAAFIGWFHLRPSFADASMLELGYRLRRAAWGKGFATEGGMRLLRFAFHELDQTAVDACADPGNTKSIHVMKKCGMQPAGTFIHPRGQVEVVRYLVTREQFDSIGP